jgi:hypothetical protein
MGFSFEFSPGPVGMERGRQVVSIKKQLFEIGQAN